jgi:probable HAF family extracellular repeat protein
MKFAKLKRIAAVGFFTLLALPFQLAAQDKQDHHPMHHHYQLIDVGTFGGPQSYLNLPGLPAPGVLNNRGTLVGWADTSALDPLCFFDPDCYYPHGYRWQNGVKTDLGLLPGGLTGQANWISGNGLIAGLADNGQIDPLLGIPVLHAVLYENGGMTDLGPLPEGGDFSIASTVNNRREVAGWAVNTIPDPNSWSGYGYETRAFYWKNGVMQDLGTLGTGTDALAALINERGQVVGWSYTNSVASPVCPGFGFALTTGSFIWDKKNGMKDLGSLGGTCTLAFDLNNRGQVVGGSSGTGDQAFHPFVWDAGTGITKLPTNAGLYGDARWINDHGEALGWGDAPGADAPLNAMLWRKSSGKWQKTDLGRLHGTNFGIAVSINASGQVLGYSGTNSSTLAFLWEDGGPMVDLNTLVSFNSGIQLFEAGQINDRGEIAVDGVDANGHLHAVLLIPCDENHSGVEGCDYSLVDTSATADDGRM